MTHHITEFGTALPKKLTISQNEKKVMVCTTLNTSDIILEDNANLTLIALISKGWHEKQFLNFYLDGKFSHLTFIALIFGENYEEFPFETISNHEIPHTEGYYHVRSALADHSKIFYKGNLIIKKSAQITNCHLSHDTLMLSKNAKVETIPSLEIQADDVKAGHSATISKVDPELLFYFQSRGMAQKEASTLLTKAFMSADLDKISDPEVRKHLDNALDDLLNHAHV